MKHLYIICAYRARGKQAFRKQQLDTFLAHMKTYMQRYDQKYTLIVFEQNDDRPFNRGMLFNIGYLEAKKLCKPDEENIFCHHNVDLIPTNVDYFNFDGHGFKDIQGWDGGLGAMYFFGGTDYEKINGYPNNLWGWGGDDTALMNRVLNQKIPIDRSAYNNGDMYELKPNIEGWNDDSRNGLNRNIQQHQMKDGSWLTNGLNRCPYTIVDKSFNEDLQYWHYLVNLDIIYRH